MPLDRSAIVASLLQKGFVSEFGDHEFFNFKYKGKITPIYTKVSYGTKYKTISDDLVSKLARQLKLPTKNFKELVICTFTEAEYIDHLISMQLINP